MTPDQLRDTRKRLNHTQHSLAAALGMGVWGWQSINAFEKGRKPISAGFAAKVEQLDTNTRNSGEK
jgi:transcriptional regulator with XRE-family HTH domain